LRWAADSELETKFNLERIAENTSATNDSPLEVQNAAQTLMNFRQHDIRLNNSPVNLSNNAQQNQRQSFSRMRRSNSTGDMHKLLLSRDGEEDDDTTYQLSMTYTQPQSSDAAATLSSTTMQHLKPIDVDQRQKQNVSVESHLNVTYDKNDVQTSQMAISPSRVVNSSFIDGSLIVTSSDYEQNILKEKVKADNGLFVYCYFFTNYDLSKI
jgi:hypothetical protein